MDQEHKAGLAKFFCNRKRLVRFPLRWESLLQIDLTAASGQARYSLFGNRSHDSIAVPVAAKPLGTHKGVVLVKCMLNLWLRLGNSKSIQLGECFCQDLGIRPPGFHPI